MSAVMDSILWGWNYSLDYAQKLLKDIPAEKMAARVIPGAGHPAWILSHLCIYHPAIEGVIRGRPFDDPKNHPHFAFGSEAVEDPSRYAPKDQLLERFIAGHQAVEAALRQADPAILEKPAPLERWRKTLPTVGIILVDLALVHEPTHLGQISYWRRVLGLSRAGG